MKDANTEDQVRWFLRTLHRSGMTARADVVIVFPWNPIPIQILRAIDEENRSFMKSFTTVIREASVQQTMLRGIVNMSRVDKFEQLLSSSRIVVNKGGWKFYGKAFQLVCTFDRYIITNQ
jgi:hypothetical protein